MSRFDPVWQSLDETVALGWAPGIVAGIRHRGETVFHATGNVSLNSHEPMQPSTPFRIASLSKVIGGALAVSLIADGTLGIDDAVQRWLPELANPRVLARPDALLDETVPADKPITLRHLLTMTNGIGFAFDPSTVTDEITKWGIGPFPPNMTPDAYMVKIGSLPLSHQPGARWMYHTSSDILGVLLSRATGVPLHDLLRERITGPLNMKATDFWASGAKPAVSYMPTADGLEEFTAYIDAFSKPPLFESLGGGLISTVEDYMTFLTALVEGHLIPNDLRAQMTSDQLTKEQRSDPGCLLDSGVSWGWQTGVDIEVTKPWTNPGRYGWSGGSGTSAQVDPSRNLIGIVLTQRFMSGPGEDFSYFWGPLHEVAG